MFVTVSIFLPLTNISYYGHKNAIRHNYRPFSSVKEMDRTIIDNHNSLVTDNDTVVHCGDFTLIKNFLRVMENYVDKLNGKHLFISGSHDYWLKNINYRIWNKTKHNAPGAIWEKMINDKYIVACHYAIKVWARSHYGSWQVYGHSHGRLPPEGKQWDVGVDANNYYPVSMVKLTRIMKDMPDNFNLIKG